MQSTHDSSASQAPPPPENRWVDLLYQAALLRNTWQPVNIADLPALGAMHSWGLVEFLHVPESRSWFTDDEADPHAEPLNAAVHSGGRHWRMTAKGEAWLREVLRRREQLGLDQAVDRAMTPTAAQAAEPVTTQSPVTNEPILLLHGWRDIVETLRLSETMPKATYSERRRRLAYLNGVHGGPIQIGKRGSQPVVDRSALLAWWQSLTTQAEATRNRERDRQATVRATYHFGRTGIVVPDLGGSIRRRKGKR